MKKKILNVFLAASLVLSLSACGGSKTIDYELDGKTGTYTGEVEDKLPNGVGEFVSENYSYSGEWLNGLPDGEGEYKNVDGEVTYTYTGTMKEGKREGEGKNVVNNCGDVTIYNGSFVNDNFEGKGNLTQNIAENKYIYDGEFAEGYYEGAGTMNIEYSDGSTETYVGTFMNGVPFGYTELTVVIPNENTYVYKGEFSSYNVPTGATYLIYNAAGNEIDAGKYINGEFVSDYYTPEVIAPDESYVDSYDETVQDDSLVDRFVEGGKDFLIDKAYESAWDLIFDD